MKITTCLQEGQTRLWRRGGRTVAELALRQGEARFTAYYDFRDAPLVLSGPARAGAALEVRLRPYRLELWVEGALADEEWPCGKALWEEAPLPEGVTAELLPEEGEAPSVLGELECAQGWRPGGGVFVGDCMPYATEDRYHVLYLKDRRHHRSKWGLGAHQWAHISTADLHRWQIHPMAVEITDPAEGSICTGSWIRDSGKEYLYYTVRTCDGSPAPLRRSVSRDGYHFSKDPDFAVMLSERYTGASARDPKVIRGEDGSFHLFLTTSLRREKKGCLAHLVSPNLEDWRELEPIYVSGDEREPECPDFFSANGWYYLVFSLGGRGEYLYSREPFGGWRRRENPFIPCKSVPKAALFHNRILFAGFDGQGQYGGAMTFLEAEARADGGLTFHPVHL